MIIETSREIVRSIFFASKNILFNDNSTMHFYEKQISVRNSLSNFKHSPEDYRKYSFTGFKDYLEGPSIYVSMHLDSNYLDLPFFLQNYKESIGIKSAMNIIAGGDTESTLSMREDYISAIDKYRSVKIHFAGTEKFSLNILKSFRNKDDVFLYIDANLGTSNRNYSIFFNSFLAVRDGIFKLGRHFNYKVVPVFIDSNESIIHIGKITRLGDLKVGKSIDIAVNSLSLEISRRPWAWIHWDKFPGITKYERLTNFPLTSVEHHWFIAKENDDAWIALDTRNGKMYRSAYEILIREYPYG